MNQIGLPRRDVWHVRSEPVAHAERHEQLIEVADPKIVHSTTFDPTDLGLGYARSAAQLALAPPRIQPGCLNHDADDVKELQAERGCAHS